MKSIKLLALAAILMPMMFSCSGGASSSNSALLGSLPDEYAKFQEEKAKIGEEAKNIKSEADKKKLIEKAQKMEEKWSAKLEESAKSLNGKPLEFAESDIKVTEPVSFEFDGFFSKSSMNPKFKINGGAEAATEINTGENYVLGSERVYIIGYDADGQKVCKIHAGSIDVENIDGKSVVKAGTPVRFSSFHFNSDENYGASITIKLEVAR